MQVHTRAEDDVTTVLLGFVSDGFTHLSYQLGIPGRSQTGTNREGCGIVGLVGTLTCRINTYTCRAIREHCSRNAETGDGW